MEREPRAPIPSAPATAPAEPQHDYVGLRINQLFLYDARQRFTKIEQALSCLGICNDAWSSTRSPFWPSLQRFAPGSEASITCGNSLTIAHQCNDYGPVGMAGQDVEKQRRFALCMAEFAPAKVCIPCPLGFIKYDHVLMGWLSPWQIVTQKADERLNRTFDLLSSGSNAAALISRVARQCLTRYVDKR